MTRLEGDWRGMTGEILSELVWLAEILVILVVSVRQIWKGAKALGQAAHGGERRMAWAQIATGCFGFVAFLWFVGLLFNAVFVFPTVPPPDVVCTECYDRLRSSTNRVLLLGGFFFVILLILVPEFLNRSLSRWWRELPDEEKRKVRRGPSA